jgi:hypothetical protein
MPVATAETERSVGKGCELKRRRVQRSIGGLLTMALGLCIGCGDDELDGKGSVRLGEVPAVVVKAVQAELPELAIESAVLERRGSLLTYEIVGRDRKGQKQTIAISREGKILSKK